MFSIGQADGAVLDQLLKIVGGGAVTGLLVLLFWFFLSGKIIPRWVWDEKCKQCDAERQARESAEARLAEALALLNKTGNIAEKIVDAKPAARTPRQEGSRP
jgi:uncharacterized membrane protein